MDTSRLRSMSHCKISQSPPGRGSCLCREPLDPTLPPSSFALGHFTLWFATKYSTPGGVVAVHLHNLAKGGRGEPAVGLTMEYLTQTATNEAQFSCRTLRRNVFNL